MLQQLKERLQQEETQRALLKGAGIVTTFVATQIFAHYFNEGWKAGTELLMTKLHGTSETPAAE